LIRITDFVYDVSKLAPIAATILAEIVRKAGTWTTRMPKPFASKNSVKSTPQNG